MSRALAEQPCVACEGNPQHPNSPCAVCGRKAEQQPVACLVETEQGVMLWPIEDINEAENYCEENEFPVLLYTSPPAQRKPLTGAEIRKWWSGENGLEDCRMAKLDDFEKVVRAIEAAHGIKENT